MLQKSTGFWLLGVRGTRGVSDSSYLVQSMVSASGAICLLGAALITAFLEPSVGAELAGSGMFPLVSTSVANGLLVKFLLVSFSFLTPEKVVLRQLEPSL